MKYGMLPSADGLNQGLSATESSGCSDTFTVGPYEVTRILEAYLGSIDKDKDGNESKEYTAFNQMYSVWKKWVERQTNSETGEIGGLTFNNINKLPKLWKLVLAHVKISFIDLTNAPNLSYEDLYEDLKELRGFLEQDKSNGNLNFYTDVRLCKDSELKLLGNAHDTAWLPKKSMRVCIY